MAREEQVMDYQPGAPQSDERITEEDLLASGWERTEQTEGDEHNEPSPRWSHPDAHVTRWVPFQEAQRIERQRRADDSATGF